MQNLIDLHTHTVYSDGKDTPRQMVEAALAAGLLTIGFSDHSYTYFDESYAMDKDSIGNYKSEISALKKEFAGRIDVRLGIEQDYWSEESTAGYEYVIGSLHYVKAQGRFLEIDWDEQRLEGFVCEYFGGDFYAFAEKYYETLSDLVRKTGADIIGHFDLIRKFNKDGRFFDESNPRYVKAWRSCADELLKTGKPFEINTALIRKGMSCDAYPSAEIRSYLKERGASFILSSDAHDTDSLCADFDRFADEV